MKRANMLGVLGIAAIIAGAGCAAQKTATATANRSPEVSGYEERPFVEGEQAPIPQCGYAWCLEKRDAVYRQVTEKTVIRPATSYYETVPAKYESRTEQVLLEPEQQRTVLVCPAVYRDVPEQRLVEPANVEYKTIPAEYRWGTEEVEVVPERTEKIFIPARYEEYDERVMTSPARTVRENVRGCDGEDCYATRTIPAEYTTIRKKRLIAPATTELRTVPGQKKAVRTSQVAAPARVEKVEVPARYQTIMKKVLDRPAEYRQEVIPARYQTLEKKVMTVPESQKLVEVPAKYGTVCRTVLVTPERLVWVLKKRPGNSCPLPEVIVRD